MIARSLRLMHAFDTPLSGSALSHIINSGSCFNCHRRYTVVEPHITRPNDADHGGFAPLCVECWKTTKDYQKITFYEKALRKVGVTRSDKKWESVSSALRKEMNKTN